MVDIINAAGPWVFSIVLFGGFYLVVWWMMRGD